MTFYWELGYAKYWARANWTQVWESVDFTIKTQISYIWNWRCFLVVNNDSQLNSNRRKQTDLFNGAKLSDSEFRRFYKVLEAPNSVYKCANKLSQIQTIVMDNGEKQNLIYYL